MWQFIKLSQIKSKGNSHIKKKERCAVPRRGQIKSKGNSLIKKKERYAVPQRGQIN